MYAVTAAARPRHATSPWPAPSSPRWSLAGITVVGEFHYLHHDAAGRPYADPNAMGEALIAAAREAGIRLTLLDTCYLAGGLTGDGHLPLDPSSSASPTATSTPGPSRVGACSRPGPATARIGAAVALGAGRAQRRPARRSPRWPRTAPLHVHLSEQPAENARHPGVLRLHADRAARRRTGCSGRGPPRSTRPT